MTPPPPLSLSPGKNPEAWAKNLKPEDFQLLCLDGSRKPVTEAQSCHLAIVPSHAVVSRKDKADFVRRMLFNQQVWEFSPHPPHECSAHLQSCTDTPQFSCTLFLPGQWSLPLMKVGGWWLCSLLALGLSRVSQWTGRVQTHGHLKCLPETEQSHGTSWACSVLEIRESAQVPFPPGRATCWKGETGITLPDQKRISLCFLKLGKLSTILGFMKVEHSDNS